VYSSNFLNHLLPPDKSSLPTTPLVNPENEIEERVIEIFGTGHNLPFDMGIERKYISTYQLSGGNYVFHAFERI